jgi:hypothetical protein
MTSFDTLITAAPAQAPGYNSSAQSLGAELERDRLERRVARVTIAIAALRERERERERERQHRREPGAPPKHVRLAIADFEAQMEAMTTRLRDLAPDLGSTHL